ncbi:MAG TPA: hypothetical protein VKT78_14365 [Fimbriimonadaceae bacterium]|nr:hypothetical protein [Fimbriimonadaceae bacterium]
MDKKLAILLTATVDPKGMRLTARSDPAQRLRDYETALPKWLAAIDIPIVFCENSGYDISSIQQVAESHGRNVELVSFTAPPFPEARGKGYGEMLIIREALARAKTFSDGTILIKATGRIFFPNIAVMVSRWKRISFDVSCDLAPRLDWADTHLFAATGDFLTNYLVPECEYLDELAEPMLNFERIMARATLKSITQGKQWCPLPAAFRIDGISGTYNTPYRSKFSLSRHLAREWTIRKFFD